MELVLFDIGVYAMYFESWRVSQVRAPAGFRLGKSEV
jgi:hypothetical protein